MTHLLSLRWPGPPMATPAPTSLRKIKRLQDALVASGHGVDMSAGLRHFFADGMYGRELTIPAGMVVVGKMHRHQHFTILLSGEATINTDRGMERITAPHVWVSQPNAKRALVTHSECVFFTTHLNPDDTTDLDVIEARTIVPEDAIEYEAPRLPDFADDLQGVYA